VGPLFGTYSDDSNELLQIEKESRATSINDSTQRNLSVPHQASAFSSTSHVARNFVQSVMNIPNLSMLTSTLITPIIAQIATFSTSMRGIKAMNESPISFRKLGCLQETIFCLL